jgi:hypothetical protein
LHRRGTPLRRRTIDDRGRRGSDNTIDLEAMVLLHCLDDRLGFAAKVAVGHERESHSFQRFLQHSDGIVVLRATLQRATPDKFDDLGHSSLPRVSASA